MSHIQLSFCIATLNRAAFIGETLDSIIDQATDEVEIVIVDGASTDNTEEVIRSYQTRFPRINYLRLAEKGGVDQDYSRAVALAQGDFCWLMSDDDILYPGAIAAVLAATRRSHDLIVVNATVRNFDFSESIENQRLPFTEDRVYPPGDMDRLLAETATYMTFIGCVVIRRSVWEERDKTSYFGTEFIHVGVIFQKALDGGALAIAHPWIAIRAGNAAWTSRYFQIWAFKWPNLIWSFPDYADEVKNQVCPQAPWRSPKILLVLRAKGAFGNREYQRFLADQPMSARQRWMTRGIALFPGWLLNPLVLVYFQRFHGSEEFGISEFQDSPFYFANILRRWTARLRTPAGK